MNLKLLVPVIGSWLFLGIYFWSIGADMTYPVIGIVSLFIGILVGTFCPLFRRKP